MLRIPTLQQIVAPSLGVISLQFLSRARYDMFGPPLTRPKCWLLTSSPPVATPGPENLSGFTRASRDSSWVTSGPWPDGSSPSSGTSLWLAAPSNSSPSPSQSPSICQACSKWTRPVSVFTLNSNKARRIVTGSKMFFHPIAILYVWWMVS